MKERLMDANELGRTRNPPIVAGMKRVFDASEAEVTADPEPVRLAAE